MKASIRAILLIALVLASPLAHAQSHSDARESHSDARALLASQRYDDVREGVHTLAASGNPNAAALLTALRDGRLFFASDKALYIRGQDGRLTTESGHPAPDIAASALHPVRVNNAVRRAADAALGALNLFAPSATDRETAAAAVFQTRDPALLPALDRALAQEKDPSVHRAMEQAWAAVLLSSGSGSAAERLAAVAALRARGDLESRAILASLSGQPPELVEASGQAVRAIDRDLQLWNLAQNVFYGISLGSVLLLAASGLAITFGVMGVINMAHGEMVMLGAYTTFVVQQAMQAYSPGLLNLSLPASVPLAFLIAGGAGVLIERGLIRFLYGRPLETLLATFGLSLILQQAVRILFGPTNRQVAAPPWMSGATRLGGLTLTWNRLWIIAFAALVFAGLMALLRYSSLGLRMRAVTQNRTMAAAMGIRTPWIDALTFGLGSGVAGMAGVALSQIDNVSPNLGQAYIVDSFMVVVFGGAGNLWGTAVGALTLGVVNKFLEPVAGAVLGKILVLIALILFIQRKPRGLFPLRGRAAEA
ncbi:MAG: urea ABC transporter permease subunit UrtB [Acetobacteraceae bacterium]|nr:urea ABC transporter permease subunit UrtB [Acetobacteraceae bacterium]